MKENREIMQQNYLYHWTDEKGFNHIKKNGINGHEGWLYTLLNNETGGLQEYIIGRLDGKSAFGIRIDLNTIIQNVEGHCYIDHESKIGTPLHDDLKQMEYICNIDRFTGDMNKKYKEFEDYFEYLGNKFDECGKEKGWSKDKTKEKNSNYLSKLLNLTGNYRCHIEPEELEYTKIDNPRKEIPQKLKYKKMK